jgi:hypothetical protein
MGRYQADPDNDEKSGPKALPLAAFGRALAPIQSTEVDRASYVIINVEHATKFEFLYESGGSYVDYGTVEADGPIRVDINPIAWKGGDGNTIGHVTFIYRGGL